MKAFIVYLKEVQSTVDSALECKRTAREHGLDAWMLEGFTPSRADKFIEHDSRVVSDTYNQDFEDVLHLDGYRFQEDPNVGKAPIVEDFINIRKGENQLKGTYGYVIKPHAAKKLIQGAHDDGVTASDMFVKDKYVKIQVVKPRAVYVNSQDSLTGDRSFYI